MELVSKALTIDEIETSMSESRTGSSNVLFLGAPSVGVRFAGLVGERSFRFDVVGVVLSASCIFLKRKVFDLGEQKSTRVRIFWSRPQFRAAGGCENITV